MRKQWRRRRLAMLAAAGTAGLTALVWWYSGPPGAGVAVPAPGPRSPSRSPAERPIPPVDVPRIEPFTAGSERHDPLLGAISSGYRYAVVLEVNALIHSPLGRLWLGCVEDRDREEAFDRLRRAGMEPLVDLDRVALAWGEKGGEALAVASGHFERLDPAALLGFFETTPSGQKPDVPALPYGADAVTVEDRYCFLDCFPVKWALWRGRTLILSEAERARAAVDLLRGRSDGDAFAFPSSLEAAEIRAVLSARDVANWLDLDDPPLREWLWQLTTRAEVRVDAMREVRAEARITVEDPAAADDLGALFAAAVAAGRSAAREKGDWKRAELLERVTVSRGAGEFTLRLDLPLDALERRFAGCRDRGGG